MRVSTSVAMRACELAFGRLCEVGRGVPEDTPAAGLLAATARQIDRARTELAEGTEVTAGVLSRLAAASTLLDDVAILARVAPIEGVAQLTVLVDDLRISLGRRDNGTVEAG